MARLFKFLMLGRMPGCEKKTAVNFGAKGELPELFGISDSVAAMAISKFILFSHKNHGYISYQRADNKLQWTHHSPSVSVAFVDHKWLFKAAVIISS